MEEARKKSREITQKDKEQKKTYQEMTLAKLASQHKELIEKEDRTREVTEQLIEKTLLWPLDI